MPDQDTHLRLAELEPGRQLYFSSAGITETVGGSVATPVAETTSETELKTTPTYYGWFDPLRGLLALVVFVSHSGILPHSAPIADIGRHAVQVFFALSGFLVGGILIRKAQSSTSFWSTVPRFYYERCVRIWVPYFLLLLTYLTLVTVRGLWSEELVQRLIPAFTYTHNWANFQFGLSQSVAPINHMWSLGVEEQFYLLCPLLAGVLTDRRLLIAAMLAIAALLPIYLGINYYSCIAFGVAAAAVSTSVSSQTWRYARLFGFFVGIPTFCIMMFYKQEAGSLLLPLLATLVVIGLSADRPATKLGYLIGAMSYSFYLFHWLGFYLANPITQRLPDTLAVPLNIVLALTVSLGLSYASVKLVEWPLLRNRSRLAERFPWLMNISTVTAFTITATGLVWIFV